MDDLELLLRGYEPEAKVTLKTNSIVMIIDDDPGVRRALEKIFTKKGYETKGFKTGEEAVAYLSDSSVKIKVVILDIKLPRIDGYQIYRMIKKIIDVPIIIHTAYAGEDAPDSRSLDVFDHIHKGTPGSYETLCSAVERAVA